MVFVVQVILIVLHLANDFSVLISSTTLPCSDLFLSPIYINSYFPILSLFLFRCTGRAAGSFIDMCYDLNLDQNHLRFINNAWFSYNRYYLLDCCG